MDEAALFNARGAKAVDLAWRGDEAHGGPYPNAGDTRGNPELKDAYYYVAITYTLRFWFDKYKQTSGLPGGKKEKKVGCLASRF